MDLEKKYSGPGDKKLPEGIKRLGTHLRRIFSSTWNNVFSRCKKGGGGAQTCESRAFAIANAAVNRAKAKEHITDDEVDLYVRDLERSAIEVVERKNSSHPSIEE